MIKILLNDYVLYGKVIIIDIKREKYCYVRLAL